MELPTVNLKSTCAVRTAYNSDRLRITNLSADAFERLHNSGLVSETTISAMPYASWQKGGIEKANGASGDGAPGKPVRLRFYPNVSLRL